MKEESLTSAQLAHVGQAIYGEPYIAELAAAIDYDQSSVYRALQKKGRISPRMSKLARKLAARKKILIPA